MKFVLFGCVPNKFPSYECWVKKVRILIWKKVIQIRASQIRARQIRARQIRATEISSNHRELHGAIYGFIQLESSMVCVGGLQEIWTGWHLKCHVKSKHIWFLFVRFCFVQRNFKLRPGELNPAAAITTSLAKNWFQSAAASAKNIQVVGYEGNRWVPKFKTKDNSPACPCLKRAAVGQENGEY